MTPKTPISNIPLAASMATTKKPKKASPTKPAARMPGAFEGANGRLSDFNFSFSAGLEDYGHKVVEEMQIAARDIRAQMESLPATPPSVVRDVKGNATAGRKKRFSDIHREQFAKMESIADHYAAKRKVTTPQNPQKGIKRTQSQATLDQKSLPPTPSPVKKAPEEAVRKSKRVKIEPVSSFASKISGISNTPKPGSARPPPASARAAVTRRIGSMKKPMPALPRSFGLENSIRLVPTGTPAASRFPATPSARNTLNNIAPATVAAIPKFALSRPSSIPQPKPAPVLTGSDPSPKKINPRVIKQHKRLNDLAAEGSGPMSTPRVGVLSPIKLTETVDLEDPFRTTDRVRQATQGWAYQPPAGIPAMPVFPKAPNHEPSLPVTNNKRKDMTSPPQEDERDESSPPLESSPARKKLRFSTETAKEFVAKSKAVLDKARLDYLATPKRMSDKKRGGPSTVKKSAVRRPMWK